MVEAARVVACGGGHDGVEVASPGRHRQHRFPAREHAMKVLYDDAEIAKLKDAKVL